MDANYWYERWATKRTGWHQDKPNDLLLKHLPKLSLPKSAHIFIPLCGKTKDIAWLLSEGYAVSGAELDESAVVELFSELGVQPTIEQAGDLKRFSSPRLCVFVGDIFLLTAEQLDVVDACYDRAALVALPPTMRKTYTQHLIQLTKCAPQLLIAFTYDQSLLAGPPHSVPLEEIEHHYQSTHRIQSLSANPVKGGLKGLDSAIENVWHLLPV